MLFSCTGCLVVSAVVGFVDVVGLESGERGRKERSHYCLPR